ncbi:MAG: GNAT family N-acetyltransferase [Candidatus Micrarchaeota archaeon]|nr:GNAT family N-acetyltransferase [Candidatus Micrarchaeota archaeon]
MLNLRPLKGSDFEQYCENEKSYYKELERNPRFGVGTYGKKADAKYLKESFSRLILAQKSGKGFTIVAEYKGKMVGICSVEPSGWREGPHIGEIGFSVLKGYRHKGIGSAMLKEAIARARGKYEILSAGTYTINKESEALMKKFGFKVWGIAPRFIKRGKIYLSAEMLYLMLK